MSLKKLLAVVALGIAAAACQQVPKDMTVADYCSNAKNANKDVCKVMVEVDGQKRSLSQTNMSLTEARSVADDAMRRAVAAQTTADEALTLAKAAGDDDLQCNTKTVNRTNVGSCEPGYKLLSCTQTRYTYRAGAPSIMREINDEQCRFNDKVLEIQVRCCSAGTPLVPTTAAQPVTPAEPEQKPAAGQSS